MKTKSPKSDKINIVTLGCSKNLVDSEVLIRQIESNNLKVVHDSNTTDAGTVIINTCGFINDAKEESVNTILEFARAKEEGLINNLYVMGCLSERYKPELEKEIPDVDRYFGSNNIKEIVEQLNIDYKKELIGERRITTPSHFAYLKISEGCNRKCSFCAIPIMRGKHVSKPIEAIEKEARNLVSQGVKEILLIAQDLSFYGYDIYGELKLAELLERLAGIKDLHWIKLHYVYPSGFPDNVIQVIKKHQNICNYIDMPLQHASDNMLKVMRRGINRLKTEQLIQKFRKEIPGIAIRTTLLVGHPGETEEDFEILKDFVKAMKFERLGVFTFSNEEDTHAYKTYKDEIPEKVKQQRMEEIMEIQNAISLEYNQKQVGKQIEVIIDRREGDYYIGRSAIDSPEVDNEILIKSSKKLITGNFYHVQITEAGDYDLYASLEN